MTKLGPFFIHKFTSHEILTSHNISRSPSMQSTSCPNPSFIKCPNNFIKAKNNFMFTQDVFLDDNIRILGSSISV